MTSRNISPDNEINFEEYDTDNDCKTEAIITNKNINNNDSTCIISSPSPLRKKNKNNLNDKNYTISVVENDKVIEKKILKYRIYS